MSLTTYAFTDLGTIARGSVKQLPNASGVWTEIAANTLPRAWDPATLAARGVWVEGERQNGIRNPRAEGAVLGIVGSGGAVPTNWALTAGGLTVEVLARTTMGGVEIVRVRASGTATGSVFALQFDTNTAIVAAPSQTWAGSAFIAVTAAPTPPLSYRTAIVGRTSGGAAVSGNTFNATIVPTSTLTRYAQTATLTSDGTIARVSLACQATITSGQSYDFTVEIGWPQMEQAPFASSPPLPPVGAPAAFTRAADAITLPLASALWGFNAAAGVLVLDAVIQQPAPAGANQTLVALTDGTDANRLLLRNLAGGNTIQAVSHIAGADAVTLGLGSMTPGAPLRVALRYGLGGIAAALNGGAEVSSPTPHPAALLTGSLLVGRGMTAGGTFLNGFLADLLYRAGDVPAGQASVLSNPAADVRALLSALG